MEWFFKKLIERSKAADLHGLWMWIEDGRDYNEDNGLNEAVEEVLHALSVSIEAARNAGVYDIDGLIAWMKEN